MSDNSIDAVDFDMYNHQLSGNTSQIYHTFKEERLPSPPQKKSAPKWKDCNLCGSPGRIGIEDLIIPEWEPKSNTVTYQTTAQLKIFLSYGHDRYQSIAFHIKKALQDRGHSVWVDTEQLPAGIDWEEGISDALSWIKDAKSDGRVLLFMTPHALRRPNGYCLNEIARAASLNLSIFPILVVDTEPPYGISRLPFFDFRHCIPNDLSTNTTTHNSDEWKMLMKDALHDQTFYDKVQRLITIVELFDSITAYGVPAVAGPENLGSFSSLAIGGDSADAGIQHLHSKTSMRDPSCSTPSSSTSETSYHRSTQRDILEPPCQPSITESNSTSSHRKRSSLDMTVPENTRYMFSFDDSCYLLAKKLYEDLSVIGFEMFPPPEPPIEDNEDSIHENNLMHEKALQWVIEDKHIGKMILLVTPESVGRPSGVCLNDISAAMTAGLGFVPLMVRQCEIPLSICRIQWLDMTDCLLYKDSLSKDTQSPHDFSESIKSQVQFILNEARYSSRRDQLAKALRGKLDHEGQQARLFSTLSPFSFTMQISKLTNQFVGREWLFKQLHKWIQTPIANRAGSSPHSNQIFWITGQIGSGKTSIAARIVQTMPEVAAFHFALLENEQTQSSRRCILSLAYQLTTQLPEYAHFLKSGQPLEEMVPVSSFQTLVTALLVEPLNAIARPGTTRPLILLIDGLEHFSTHSHGSVCRDGPTPFNKTTGVNSQECLVSLLPSLVSRLPSWVRVIVLSRDDIGIRSKLQLYTPTVALDQYQDETQRDIRTYVKFVLSGISPEIERRPEGFQMAPYSDSIASQLEKRSFSRSRGLGTSRSSFNLMSSVSQKITPEHVASIAKQSEGLFLYAVNIVNAIRDGRISLSQLDSLPIGMVGYLRQFFDSQFTNLDEYKLKIRPVLEVLCSSYEPLTLGTLSSIFRWSSYDELEIADAFGSLFTIVKENDCQYLKPFHSSVLEWVQEAQNAGVYYVDAINGHERLGKWAASEYDRVVRAQSNTFINLNYALENSGSGNVSEQHKIYTYIIRHACNHLMQGYSIECMQLVGKFASDEDYQLARRLLRLRYEGLESFFHGDISREDAEELLLTCKRDGKCQKGSFLIRYSHRVKSYCASFIEDLVNTPSAGVKPKFTHNLIYHLENGAYSVVPPHKVTDTTLLFPDLVSFVEVYQRKGILHTAIPRHTPLNREISST